MIRMTTKLVVGCCCWKHSPILLLKWSSVSAVLEFWRNWVEETFAQVLYYYILNLILNAKRAKLSWFILVASRVAFRCCLCRRCCCCCCPGCSCCPLHLFFLSLPISPLFTHPFIHFPPHISVCLVPSLPPLSLSLSLSLSSSTLAHWFVYTRSFGLLLVDQLFKTSHCHIGPVMPLMMSTKMAATLSSEKLAISVSIFDYW